MKTVYDFTVKDRQGNDVPLADYKGKVVSRFEPTFDMKKVKEAVENLL